MRDGVLRRLLKLLALGVYRFDLASTRLLRRDPPRYRLAGECQACGACCETPTVQTNYFFFRFRSTRWAILAWHRWVNGFAFLHDLPRENSFVFRCSHLDPASGRCDSYASRPGMCRDYPRFQLDTAAPEFFPACGHRAVDLHAASFNASLEQLDLPPAQLEALRRRLHLEE